MSKPSDQFPHLPQADKDAMDAYEAKIESGALQFDAEGYAIDTRPSDPWLAPWVGAHVYQV